MNQIKDDEETIDRYLYIEKIEKEKTKIQTKLRNLSSSNDLILF
jgi:hypothetical protein